MAEKLQLALAEDSVEADKTSPCLVCAHRVDLGDSREAVLVRLTEIEAPTCPYCCCALGFGGCTNKPRRGNFVVPACSACVQKLDVKLSTFAPFSKPKSGLPYAQMLLQETDAESLTKKGLWPVVKNFSGSCATADAIYNAEGKVGLATRIATQIALQHRDAEVASRLRTPLSFLLKRKRGEMRGTLARLRRGGHGAQGSDIKRAECTDSSWDARRSLSVTVSGDAPLRDVEAATSSTVERYRATKVESDGKNVDERAALLSVTRSASRVEASLASQPLAATRRSALARADAVARHLVEDRKARAVLKASRSPEEEERLAEKRKKNALAAAGVSWAEQADTDPRDGEATVENHRTKLDDQKKKSRNKATKRRKCERDVSGLDPVQTAILKKVRSEAKRLASKKRAKEDDGSGRWVLCETEGCKKHGVKIMYHGTSLKQCPYADGGCGRRMAFM